MTTSSVSEQEICPNCRRTVARHRPWCSEFVTQADPPKQGDVVDDPVFGPTTLISVYLREDAIRDGVLVDCTQDELDELNRKAGLIFDVAMTRAVFERYVEVPDESSSGQHLKGRYWDILIKFREAAVKEPDAHEVHFDFLSIPNGTGTLDNERPSSFPRHSLVELKAVSGAGDRGEPILTFMLPDED